MCVKTVNKDSGGKYCLKKIIYDIKDNNLEQNISKIDINMTTSTPLFFDLDSYHRVHNKFVEKVFKCYVKKGEKYICWFYIGIKNGIMKCSYSAPFSKLYVLNRWRFEDLIDVGNAIKEIGIFLKVNKISITFPPDIYDSELINAWIPVLLKSGFKIEYIDVNNYFKLDSSLNKDYFIERLSQSYRKQYNQALDNNLQFKKLPTKQWKKAYNIILKNRLEKSYPLRISINHMEEIIDIPESEIDFFIVKFNEIEIAAAIVFKITEDICQVVYWGDLIQYRSKRAMSFLVANLVEYYSNSKKKYLDVGTSSEKGQVNVGLVNYKKSIGCSTNLKYSLYFDLKY